MINQRTRIATWEWYYCKTCEELFQLNIPVGTNTKNMKCALCGYTVLQKPPHRVCEKYPHKELKTPFCVDFCGHLDRETGECKFPE